MEKHTLASVDQKNKVSLKYRKVHTKPLTMESKGGIIQIKLLQRQGFISINGQFS